MTTSATYGRTDGESMVGDIPTDHRSSDRSTADRPTDDRDVLKHFCALNLESLERSGLDPEVYFLVRLAALVAMDAEPASYLANLSLGSDAGATSEQAQAALIAIAPIVGTARIVAAAGNALRALGLATVLADESDP